MSSFRSRSLASLPNPRTHATASVTQRNPSFNQFNSTHQGTPSKLKKEGHKRVLILNGKITSKEDIFDIVRYYKSLAGNKPEIRMK